MYLLGAAAATLGPGAVTRGAEEDGAHQPLVASSYISASRRTAKSGRQRLPFHFHGGTIELMQLIGQTPEITDMSLAITDTSGVNRHRCRLTQC